MSFQHIYRPLFVVHLDHDFALDRGEREFAALDEGDRSAILASHSIHDSLAIEPTAETRETLRRHRLRVRARPTGFAVHGAVRASTTAPGRFILAEALPAEAELRFTIAVIRPAFLHEASLPTCDPRTQALVFSTRTGHVAEDGTLHLTAPLAAFDPNRSYEAGERVLHTRDGQVALLQAESDAAAAAQPAVDRWVELPVPRFVAGTSYARDARVLHDGVVHAARRDGVLPAPPDADAWTALYTPQLRTGVSAADRTSVLGRTTRVPLDPPQAFVTVTVRDRLGQTVLQERQVRSDAAALTEAVVRLPAAPDGLYSLRVDGPDGAAIAGMPATFHLHDGAVPLAFIEIAAGGGPLALLDGDGHLLAPEYHVRFRHRRAFWRYIFHGDLDELPPADLAGYVQDDAADPARYTTAGTHPLTAGFVSLPAFDGRPLPNPAPAAIRKVGGRLLAEAFVLR